ncbi:MAG: hypothetical protein E7417_01955 [Ruminococcaceae bacterium]|nr:hypothetical protein [Oscillospiraceae bacterium]
MIKLRFYNSIGEVVFDKKNWRLTAAEGLSLATKSYTAVRYINQPGQTVTSWTDNPRTITLSGDCNLDILGEEVFSKGAGIFDRAGILEVETHLFKRQIGARCIAFEPGEKIGPFRKYVVQFLCDCPYFEDCDYTESVIYERVPMLSADTVLPAMFSKRVSSFSVAYKGAIFSQPIITVSVPEGKGTIIISNSLTNGKIEVAYDGDLIKKLIIDVENRTITDESGASKLDLMTDDSFFEGFFLESGDNQIEVANSNSATEIFATIKYKVRYKEAVI